MVSEPVVFLVFGGGAAKEASSRLERWGSTIHVDRLEAAQELLKSREVDLVLAEIPSGPEATDICARLRATAGPDVPIVALLNGAEPALAEVARRSGADFVVRSGSDLETLAGISPALARLHRRLRELEHDLPARLEEMRDLRAFTDGLVEALPSKLFIIDEEMKVLFANSAALAGSGLELKKAVGMKLSQLVPAVSSGSQIETMIRRAFTEGLHARLPLLRMGERIVNVDIHPCRLAENLCVRVVMDDVTEEWRTEEERLRESNRLQNIVDAAGAGLAVLDTNLRFVWSNRTFMNWFGPSVGKHCREVFTRSPEDCAHCAARLALEEGTFHSETWHRYVGGKRLSYQNTFVRVPEHGGAYSLTVLVQDITAQAERVEQLQLVEKISEAIQGVLELDELLHTILTCVTTGHALGFNRAFLFLRNRDTNTLDGRIAVGPASAEEAGRIWAELSARQRSLEDALRDASLLKPTELPLYPLIRDLRYPLNDDKEFLVKVFRERKPVVVKDAWRDERITPEFRARFRAKEFVVVPLVSKGRSLGVIMADNLYNARPITEREVTLLQLFASPAGLAIENAEAFADLRESLNVLKSTRKRLVEQTKLAAIGRVAAHIAHEIRNPLTTIGGFAHSIKGRIEAIAAMHTSPAAAESVAKIRESSSIIYEEVMRLERMLRGIMDFSRPSKPVPVRQSLNAAIEKVAQVLQGQLPPGIKMELSLDPATPEISFDAEQLHQVLLNLVRNAVEALQEHPSPDRQQLVKISTRPDGTGAVITVSDNGPGIPREHLHRLFEPFFTTKKGGTGLGLAVCRQIIAEHGGEIHLDTAVGRGTTFTIALPSQPPQAIEKREIDLP